MTTTPGRSCPFTFGNGKPVRNGESVYRTWSERDHLHNKAAILAQRYDDWLMEREEGDDHSPRTFYASRIQDVQAIRNYVTAAEVELVREAREHGLSWQDIGTQLGISRQAAQQRYGGNIK